MVARAKEKADNLHQADRGDELWEQVLSLPLPDQEPKSGYFQDRQAQTLLFMNQTTDLPAIEKAATDLKNEVDAYAKTMTTDTHKVQFRISLVPPPMPAPPNAAPGEFSADIALQNQPIRIRIPAERVPWEYWKSIPSDRQNRLDKLQNEDQIVSVMWEYQADEDYLRNLKMRRAMNHPAGLQPPLPFGSPPVANLSPQDLFMPWRGRPIPPELQEMVAGLNRQNASQYQINQAIIEFFTDQDQQQPVLKSIQERRRMLDWAHSRIVDGRE